MSGWTATSSPKTLSSSSMPGACTWTQPCTPTPQPSSPSVSPPIHPSRPSTPPATGRSATTTATAWAAVSVPASTLPSVICSCPLRSCYGRFGSRSWRGRTGRWCLVTRIRWRATSKGFCIAQRGMGVSLCWEVRRSGRPWRGSFRRLSGRYLIDLVRVRWGSLGLGHL